MQRAAAPDAAVTCRRRRCAGITVAWLLASQLPLLLLLAYSMWVPQLLHNISTTARRPLHVGYVLNSSFARLLLPAYTFGCSQNLLQVPAQPWLASALVGWVGLQVRMEHFWSAFGSGWGLRASGICSVAPAPT